MSNASSHNQSIITLSSLKDKKSRDTIPCRIEFIRELMRGQKFEPLINFDSTDTECFEPKRTDNDSGDSYDTRVLLKKCHMDFTNVISQLGNDGKLLYIKSGTTGHTFKGTAKDDSGEFN